VIKSVGGVSFITLASILGAKRPYPYATEFQALYRKIELELEKVVKETTIPEGLSGAIVRSPLFVYELFPALVLRHPHPVSSTERELELPLRSSSGHFAGRVDIADAIIAPFFQLRIQQDKQVLEYTVTGPKNEFGGHLALSLEPVVGENVTLTYQNVTVGKTLHILKASHRSMRDFEAQEFAEYLETLGAGTGERISDDAAYLINRPLTHFGQFCKKLVQVK